MKDLKKFIPTIDDPLVLDLLPGYLNSRRLEVIQMQRLLEDSEFEKLRIIGHNLGGSGGLYGLEPVSVLGKKLEASALSADSSLIKDIIADLKGFIEQVNLSSS